MKRAFILMKLFLTSAGFTNQEIARIFLKQLPNPVSKNRILIVAYAQNPEEDFYVNESKNEMQQLGFENIVVANMHNPIEVSGLGSFGVVYVCGGNTFSILNKLRETGLDIFIIQQVHAGAVYVGVSAGSIIAGPSIEIASWGSEGDKNEIGLKDMTGFNLVDFEVFPHFHEELHSEIEEFKKKVPYKVFELTNNQAIFVDDSEITLIGEIIDNSNHAPEETAKYILSKIQKP
jgi:dipeptidase E